MPQQGTLGSGIHPCIRLTHWALEPGWSGPQDTPLYQVGWFEALATPSQNEGPVSPRGVPVGWEHCGLLPSCMERVPTLEDLLAPLHLGSSPWDRVGVWGSHLSCQFQFHWATKSSAPALMPGQAGLCMLNWTSTGG